MQSQSQRLIVVSRNSRKEYAYHKNGEQQKMNSPNTVNTMPFRMPRHRNAKLNQMLRRLKDVGFIGVTRVGLCAGHPQRCVRNVISRQWRCWIIARLLCLYSQDTCNILAPPKPTHSSNPQKCVGEIIVGPRLGSSYEAFASSRGKQSE